MTVCNAANATNGLLPHRACQLMIGPSGTDKTTSLASEAAAGIGIYSSQILSSDQSSS